MRFIKLLILLIIAVGLIIIGFANRDIVTLTLLPAELASFAHYNKTITLPLYGVVLAGVGIGLLMGFIWEWFREGKQRSDATRTRRERAMLASENEKLKAKSNEGKDDVLVLLEEGASTR